MNNALIRYRRALRRFWDTFKLGPLGWALNDYFRSRSGSGTPWFVELGVVAHYKTVCEFRHTLNATDGVIYDYRFVGRASRRQLAERLGVTERQARKLERALIRRLRDLPAGEEP